MYLYGLGDSQLESSCWDGLGGLSMQGCSKERQEHPGLCKKKICQKAEEGDPFPLGSSGEAISGVLGPVMGSPAQV